MGHTNSARLTDDFRNIFGFFYCRRDEVLELGQNEQGLEDGKWNTY